MLKKLKTYGELVMFSHTLFSLPFALISLLWAANGMPDMRILVWSLVALIAGRNGANALNRWVDRDIDAKNPRTTTRHIPQGKVKAREALVMSIILFVLFEVAAYQINTICFLLSPIALLLFVLYSYTKRFTWACHIVLGITCAGAPVGAWLAVTGNVSITTILLGIVVVLWISGFDIIYGTQDIDFDRNNNVFSIPARFGLTNSLWIARLFHFTMVCILVSLYFIQNQGYIYILGLLISVILLTVEHIMIDPKNKAKMKIASYTLNQYVSMTLLICSYLDFFLLRGAL